MLDFLIAFVWIIGLVWPAQKIILWVASFMHKKLPRKTPIITNIPVKSATTQLKMKHRCASPEEKKFAVISAVLVAGVITIIIQFHLLFYVIIWVIVISVLVNFVNYK